VITESSDAAQPARSGPGARRIILWVAGAVLLLAITTLVALRSISEASGDTVSVLIGTLNSTRLSNLVLAAAFAAVAVGIYLIPVPRLWLLLLVPVRLAAVTVAGPAGLVALASSSATAAPLVADGCDTGYVVVEESFVFARTGTVYRPDGLLATAVAHTRGEYDYRPFADGAYTVVDDGAQLDVWYSYAFDPAAAPVAADGDPAFTLPTLTGRTPACGLSTGARTPIPPEPALPTYTPAEAQARLEEMLAASLDAAVDPVSDSAGAPLDTAAFTPATTACNETGTRTALALTFATADNAASLTRILQIWDAAGYSPDRAMQQDIRYSATLPVAQMTIRDTTTIDGLIHLQLESQCGVR